MSFQSSSFAYEQGELYKKRSSFVYTRIETLDVHMQLGTVASHIKKEKRQRELVWIIPYSVGSRERDCESSIGED